MEKLKELIARTNNVLETLNTLSDQLRDGELAILDHRDTAKLIDELTADITVIRDVATRINSSPCCPDCKSTNLVAGYYLRAYDDHEILTALYKCGLGEGSMISIELQDDNTWVPIYEEDNPGPRVARLPDTNVQCRDCDGIHPLARCMVPDTVFQK